MFPRIPPRIERSPLASTEAIRICVGAPEPSWHGFNMTALAMRLSGRVNAVSQEHGQVSRRMWSHLWPGVPEEAAPIRHVTNGIHAPTWIAPELNSLYAKYLTPSWA